MNPIPWKRVHRALSQYANGHGTPARRLVKVMDALPRIIKLCGGYSQNRRVCYRVGTALLQDKPRCFVLCCPDYTHRRGRFTYQGLGQGVPMLVVQHMRFMQRVRSIFPHIGLTFLIADHEADVEALCAIMGVTREEFRRRTARSIIAARARVAPHRWSVRGFTEEIQDFSLQEEQMVRTLMGNPRFQARLANDTAKRVEFYKKIGYQDPALWRERTIHNAAQYLVVGQYVTAQRALVCNHHSINLAWFLRTLTPFLDNPIKIY